MPPEDPEVREVYNDLTARRAHSWRNFDPNDLAVFMDLLEEHGENLHWAREVLEYMESGRFMLMLKAVHRFTVHLDADELKEFARLNTDLMEWVVIYARAEKLNTHEHILGDEFNLPW